MINATFSSFLHPLFFGLWHLPSLTHIYLSVFTNFLHICRGTKWICSSKYLFFRQICAGKTFRKNSIPLEGNCCCWDIDNSGCLRGLHGCLEWMSWVRNSYIFPCSLPKCLKWFKKSLFMLCCFFFSSFFQNFLLSASVFARRTFVQIHFFVHWATCDLIKRVRS